MARSNTNKGSSSYVLITPARNEEAYVEKTIQSVVSQTILPLKWVIISDRSTDRTDEIVKQYMSKHDFIELLRRESNDDRNFGAKVHAIRAGIKRLQALKYDFIGNVDADVSFNPDYHERLLYKFHQNPSLGIGGGKVYDYDNGTFKKQLSSLKSVAGPIQFFRKECYEQIGGYVIAKEGLEDAIAEVSARMNGWQTETFPELIVLHHRKTGSEGVSILRSACRQGKLEYLFGYHFLFHIARSLLRILQKPIIIGSLLRTSSYFYYNFKKPKRIVSKDFVNFLRNEEMKKLKDLFYGRLKF